jgi:cell division protein ZapA
VLAALNFAHELQQLRDETRQRDTEVARTLAGLQLKLDALLRDAG